MVNPYMMRSQDGDHVSDREFLCDRNPTSYQLHDHQFDSPSFTWLWLLQTMTEIWLPISYIIAILTLHRIKRPPIHLLTAYVIANLTPHPLHDRNLTPYHLRDRQYDPPS